MKKILVVSYSQSGQLTEILDRFTSPFDPALVEHVKITPREPFPFPWTTDEFFDKMPECVEEQAIELEPVQFSSFRYELIVFGYQPWFLSPSLPATSLLQSPAFKMLLSGTPVVTVIGGRNMWLNSQESIKKYIADAGGRLVANIPFMDRTTNLVSAVTILHWMLTGRKDRKWNIFPYPGVSREDISNGARFGKIVREAFDNDDYWHLQQNILALGLIHIPTDILFIEQRAKKLFRIWAGLIRKKGTTPVRRRRLVTAFKYYLLVALFIVAPVVVTIYRLLIAPFFRRAIKKKKEYFCGVETKP
ncbi:hypothetical protein [Dyadobacter sandarakinus]|uniref:Dialkylrecorsinol condensing enzyme DarA n=1 Tax=Dyadobacter sandarakinus TaxID=2747268 RepID=A0ABX7IDT8_9BACT|nr:hypothetical protein [Dyadobacter sandarakinus]QRR03970.1 hypothetical protein HWI92_25170 [Dyadobacter sandarakinus]